MFQTIWRSRRYLVIALALSAGFAAVATQQGAVLHRQVVDRVR